MDIIANIDNENITGPSIFSDDRAQSYVNNGEVKFTGWNSIFPSSQHQTASSISATVWPTCGATAQKDKVEWRPSFSGHAGERPGANFQPVGKLPL